MSDRKTNAVPIGDHFADDSDERNFLGALVGYPDETTALAGGEIGPDLFSSDPCREMFRAAAELRSRGAPLSIITLTDELRCRGALESAGGPYEVTRLGGEFAVRPSMVEPCLARMRHKAAMRLIGEDALHFAQLASNWGTDPAAASAAMASRAERLQAVYKGSSATHSKWEDAFSRGALTGKELRDLTLIPRSKLIADWFCESDLGFLFAARGVGKTWLSLFLGMGVANGTEAGPWKAHGAHPVLYIDGEMPLELIQTRNGILSGASDNLHYINHEQLFDSTGEVLNLTDRECQQAVTSLCKQWKIKLLVLDNLSCLFRGVSENDADAWEQILPWLLELRRQKIAVLFVVHAGRNGQMRGTSRREDAAAWVIRLDDAGDSTAARTGARFVSTFTKPSRNTPDNPPPLEWSISTNASTGEATVFYKPAEGEEAVIGWVRNGLVTCSEIAEEMHMSKGAVSKMATKLIEAGRLRKSGRGYALSDSNTPETEDEQ